MDGAAGDAAMELGRKPSRGRNVVDEDKDEVRLAGGAVCPVLALA